jgi:3-oxoacyl-[acyl-carrier protein] reductase
VGKVAVITGAARGIGFAVASRLAREGATVALLDRDEGELVQAAKKLEALQAKVLVIRTDVRMKDDVKRAMETASALGGLHILVNSAGITGRTNIRTAEVDPDDWENVFAVNIRGTFLTCKFALPVMESQRYGRIVNIASIAGKEGNASMAAYSASKAAVIGLTKTIGKEYAESGVTCNAVAPAVIRTDMVEALPQATVDYMTSKIPMRRCGTLDEISSLVAWIASDEASFTTAFTFDASGGRATY